MTRRLDPMDRVYEFSDASVPFAISEWLVRFEQLDHPNVAIHRRDYQSCLRLDRDLAGHDHLRYLKTDHQTGYECELILQIHQALSFGRQAWAIASSAKAVHKATKPPGLMTGTKT